MALKWEPEHIRT